MSTSVEVRCAMCDRAIGEQRQPGDGALLFRAHLYDSHPSEARALAATEAAVVRIPWPPK